MAHITQENVFASVYKGYYWGHRCIGRCRTRAWRFIPTLEPWPLGVQEAPVDVADRITGHLWWAPSRCWPGLETHLSEAPVVFPFWSSLGDPGHPSPRQHPEKHAVESYTPGNGNKGYIIPLFIFLALKCALAILDLLYIHIHFNSSCSVLQGKAGTNLLGFWLVWH